METNGIQGDGYDEEQEEYPSPRPIVRPTLYQSPNTKVCFFLKDGDTNFKAIKLAINPKHYNNIDTLKTELTRKVPGLPFGVRSLYTPRGRDHVGTLDDLQNEGKYVCSTKSKAIGIDLSKLQGARPWNAGGRAPSGRRQYWAQLRGDMDRETIDRSQRRKRKSPWDTESHPGATRPPKKITIINNKNPEEKHIMLLNRRTEMSFERIIEDISEMFQMHVRRMYTTEGRPVSFIHLIYYNFG
eukprot:GHVT01096602.1.p1 GENE.GHVT01096602.1~~GHVT01096602.1.p1  ORF type:complete len:242 (+),score=0.27 GHVT01096602.1:360-1085(+)